MALDSLAFARRGKLEHFDDGWGVAVAKGWIVVSMKNRSGLEGSTRGAEPLQVLDHLLLHLLAANAVLQAAAHSSDLIS